MHLSTALLILLAAPTAALQSDKPSYPKFQFLRQNEDWSAFADYDATTSEDCTDALKGIDLGDGMILTVGGHVRARYEEWNNFNFGRPPGISHDDGFVLTRLLMHGDLHLNDSMRVFLELKTAQSTERDLPGGMRTLDVDSFDVQQAFVDVDLGGVTLRPGRQGLLFGKQRLVSPLPWGNTLRTWDGLSFMTDAGAWNVTGFLTQFAPVDIGDLNEPDEGNVFWGLYGTRAIEGGPTIDAYCLGLDRETATFNGTTGGEERITLGARVGGKLDGGIDYDAEAAYQFGEVGSGDVAAHMLALSAGYALDAGDLKPRLYAGLDLASGDEGAGGDVETFNQLFPLGHAYLGFLDAIGRQNILSLHAGCSVKPTDNSALALTYHTYELDHPSDALYNAGGGVSVAGGSASDDVGSEIDLTWKYSVDRHTSVLLGYSLFMTDSVIEDSAADTSDANTAYVSVQYTF